MGIVAKYKFNQNTYADFIPTFNSEFTDYTITDEIGTDGFTIRTIESDDLPTLMQFGTASTETKSYSLLSVLKCNTDNIISMSEMFNNSRNLTSINLSSFNTQNVTNMGAMFKNCTSLTSLDLSNFNTNQVTSMGSMFYGCSNLTSLDLSSFNTEKITNMYGVFYGCSKLTSLNLSSFNTENVNNMSYMFYNCKYLTSLNISNFNTQNVTTMSNMFNGCSNLTSLDLSSFNTEKVTSMSYMFCKCSSLTSLDLKSFNTQKVTNTNYMFTGWSSSQKVYISSKWTLGTGFTPTFIATFAYTIAKYKFNQNTYADFLPTFNSSFTDYVYSDEIDTDGFTIRTIGNDSGDLPTVIKFGSDSNTDSIKSLLEVYKCNTSRVTDMSYMFSNCRNLTSLDLSGFNTENVKNMDYMFYYCHGLTSLNLSSFNTEKVIGMSRMFSNCINLISLDLSNFNTYQLTNMENMFYNCSSLTSLDVSNFDTSKVKYMIDMFNSCSSLISLDLSNFNTSQVTNMSYMFQNCNKLTSLDVSNFDTGKVTYMNNMFYGCSSLTSLDVSNFNTEKVTNMNYMFYDCSSLTSLDVSNFNTGQVTNMGGMFRNCSKLTSLDVSSFDTNQVTSMNSIFNNCSSLTSLDVSNFNTEKVTNMSWMFNNCSSLTSLDVSNFNTENVTDMSGMFYNCSSLTSLDLSNFNTEKVTDMSGMFNNCYSLTSLDISNFKIDKKPSINYIFNDMKNIENIGMIYCSSTVINYLTLGLDGVRVNVWYSSSNSSELIQRNYITFKEYKMNILESDEEIILRRVGDVYDELNLETGELTQRVGEIVLDGNILGGLYLNGQDNFISANFKTPNVKNQPHYSELGQTYVVADKFISSIYGWDKKFESISIHSTIADTMYLTLESNKIGITSDMDTDEKTRLFKKYLSDNPITVQYQLATELVKTVDLKNKPSINWQGDTYIYLENNTLYPQLECEIESINYYEIPKLKANTLYTLRYIGEPTECIFGGLTYETENNMILTSGSSDNLLYFDKEVRNVILIEGDVRDRNFDYFEGIESLGAVEIVTHKTNMPIFAKGGRK